MEDRNFRKWDKEWDDAAKSAFAAKLAVWLQASVADANSRERVMRIPSEIRIAWRMIHRSLSLAAERTRPMSQRAIIAADAMAMLEDIVVTAANHAAFVRWGTKHTYDDVRDVVGREWQGLLTASYNFCDLVDECRENGVYEILESHAPHGLILLADCYEATVDWFQKYHPALLPKNISVK